MSKTKASPVPAPLPADDGDGVTAEWVKTLLPASEADSELLHTDGRVTHVFEGILGRLQWRDDPAGVGLFLNNWSIRTDIVSRGAIRRLCEALCVQTYEGVGEAAS